MTIELEIKELKIDKVHNKESYPKEGLYLVNDGIVWLLVSATNDNIYTMPLHNKDIVKQLEFNSKNRCMEDIKGTIYSKLDYLIGLLERQDSKPIAIHNSSEPIDIDKITELIKSVTAPFMPITR